MLALQCGVLAKGGMTLFLNLPFAALQTAYCCLIVATAMAEGAVDLARRKR